jgi:hypothetical protein
MSSSDTVQLPRLLRLPAELRDAIFNFVASTHPNKLRSPFLSRTLYVQASLIFYRHWIPKIDLFGDEHELHLSLYPAGRPLVSQPGHGRECSTASFPKLFRLFQTLLNPQPKKVIPQPIPSRISETITWLNDMPDIARQNIRRVEVRSMHFRFDKARLRLNEMLAADPNASSRSKSRFCSTILSDVERSWTS